MGTVDPFVDLSGVKVGDTLLHFVRMGGRREAEQVPTEKVVAKVGRTLVYVPKYPERPELGLEAYRIEGGYRNDNYGHSQLMTREQVEDKALREELTARLKKHGFEYNWRSDAKPTTVLAAVLKVLDDAEKEN